MNFHALFVLFAHWCCVILGRPRRDVQRRNEALQAQRDRADAELAELRRQQHDRPAAVTVAAASEDDDTSYANYKARKERAESDRAAALAAVWHCAVATVPAAVH